MLVSILEVVSKCDDDFMATKKKKEKTMKS